MAIKGAVKVIGQMKCPMDVYRTYPCSPHNLDRRGATPRELLPACPHTKTGGCMTLNWTIDVPGRELRKTRV